MEPTSTPQACGCWSRIDKEMQAKYQLRISRACSSLRVAGLDFRLAYQLPLERMDGKKPKPLEPKFITISHCPFCGAVLPTGEEGE